MNATDHRAEATRLLSAIDTRDWSDPSPYIDRRTEAAKTHALLAIHDLLDARQPATTPPGTVDAPVAEGGSVAQEPQNGQYGPEGDETTIITREMWDALMPEKRTWRLATHPGELQEGQSVLFDAGGSPKTGYLMDDSNVLATEDWEVVVFADDGEPHWAEGITNVHVRAPLPVTQGDEVIVKRADLTTALGVLEALNPFQDRAHEKWMARLDAALDRGQGA